MYLFRDAARSRHDARKSASRRTDNRSVEMRTTCLVFVGLMAVGGCGARIGADDPDAVSADSFRRKVKRLGHIVVIHLENHSFDNLYGEFRGAEGLSSRRAKG